MEKWSVVACDQHSSEPEYWKALDGYVGNAPSTLRLMLPEAYLDRDVNRETALINETMKNYLSSGVFRCVEDSYIYVERTLANGKVRRGLMGALNLAEYDYSTDSTSLIRATEGTVEDRLPARVKIREGAALEMPHIMVFINDPENKLFDSAVEFCRSGEVEPLYDFELNMGGGHIKGSRLYGSGAKRISDILSSLEDAIVNSSGDNLHPAVIAVGDGNHSLATAKKCGSAYALVELVNIYDPSIEFEPIHRVVFDTDSSSFSTEFETLGLDNISNYAEKVRAAESFCCEYVHKHGGYIDYIHNDETALELGSRPNCAALLLSKPDKAKLFSSIEKHGPFPKKSFSIGHAEDKRYYLECRKI